MTDQPASERPCGKCGGTRLIPSVGGEMLVAPSKPCPDCTPAASEAPGGGVAEARAEVWVKIRNFGAYPEPVDAALDRLVEAASAAGDARLREALTELRERARDGTDLGAGVVNEIVDEALAPGPEGAE